MEMLNVDITKFVEARDWIEKIRQNKDHVLLKMLEEGLHTDIILTARGGSVKAHRSVLSAASPVFRAMFEHDMKEQLSSTVDIPEMTIEGLKLFLLVLYTINEHLEDFLNYKTLAWLFSTGIDKHYREFFEAVLKYQALRQGLKALFEVSLDRNLTPDNCWVLYDRCLQFGEKSIYSIAHDYIINNFEQVAHSAMFLSEMRLIPKRVHTILIEVLSSGKLVRRKKVRRV